MNFIDEAEGNLKLGNTKEIDVGKQTDINEAGNETNLIGDDNEDFSPTNNTTLDQNGTSPGVKQDFSTESRFIDGKLVYTLLILKHPKWYMKMRNLEEPSHMAL